MKKQVKPVLVVVMDGLGVSKETWGNAVSKAWTPNLDYLMIQCPSTTLLAHGQAIGMPSNKDMGNSEVGHNALGAGRIFEQGAKLVQNAIQSGNLFLGSCWQNMCSYLGTSKGSVHFIGLLSDGNVHSHLDHLLALCDKASTDKVGRIRIHTLLDGRDVGKTTAEQYVETLESYMREKTLAGVDIAVASGGGRMVVTMDRYESDWSIVERGWNAHVRGEAEHKFSSLGKAIEFFRSRAMISDQTLPPFVITDENGAVGRIKDGDAVVLFNFRGDRAMQICQAFIDEDFTAFPRGSKLDIFFAGMMQYDGDLHIPKNFLVAPPQIENTMGEYLASHNLRQFACSETQKFGHVTYFCNGNRSGSFGDFEEYVEVPSERVDFACKPWMKAAEIAKTAIVRMQKRSFDCGRINFANPDMVGHTGDFAAAVVAVATVDLMLGKLMAAAKKNQITLVVTADHGNCDEMYAKPSQGAELGQVLPKTSHTLNPVPFAVFDPNNFSLELNEYPEASLGNVANTVLELMGLPLGRDYLPSLIRKGV